MLPSTAECEITVGSAISAVAFVQDGKYLVSGGKGGVQVWRLQPVERVPVKFITNESVQCVAASKDGRLFAAGTGISVYVWDAKTYERVFKTYEQVLEHWQGWKTDAIEFSPDSARLVAISGRTAIIWEVATWTTRLVLEHSHPVIAARFSPLDDRIAVATSRRVRVYDGKNGRSLVCIPAEVEPIEYNDGLAWCRNYLFVISKDTVVKIDTSTRSTVSKWTVPGGRDSSIALPKHGRFIACSTKYTVTLWDTSTYTQLVSIRVVQNLRSITFSPDDQSIAMIGRNGKIVVKHLSGLLEKALTVNFDSPTSTMILRTWTASKLTSTSWKDILAVAVDFSVPRFSLYRTICVYLERTNQIMDAVECFHRMNSELALSMTAHHEQVQWATGFKRRCAERLLSLGDAAVAAQLPDDAITHYSIALSLNSALSQVILVKRSQAYMAKRSWEDALDDTNQVIKLNPLSPWNHQIVLNEWVKAELTDGSWVNTLSTAGTFKISRFAIYKTICEYLEMIGRITDATECLHEMRGELGQQKIESNEAQWICEFKSRSCKQLEEHGDVAVSQGLYMEAISLYSAALGLDPLSPQPLFVKRSKAHAAGGMWEDTINDITKTVTLGLASHGAGYTDIFEELLVKMSLSTDADIQERCRRYKSTRTVIRRAVQDAIRDSPRVLIDTTTGSLCDKTRQAAVFESLPIFAELMTSMAPHVDHGHIKQEVARFYRYATFSHKWEDDEPLFEKITHVSVYDLEDFPTNDKLQMFCKIARDAGYHWAWSDTCCINKADHFVVQEALVSMFSWYQGSSLTIIFLRGVRSPSRCGDLVKSIWNTRAWTFQEYHASKVVRFYNEDWTLYRNLDIPNHKESLEIISEMEEAAGVSARALTGLQPGLANIREKLCLASRRETTLSEDAAYSLFGIFNVTLPVVYGERDQALGRLLAQLLASSGDTSILAWTGRSGSFNSCLPAEISVFSQLPTTHIPPAVPYADIDKTTARLRTAALNIASVTKLSDLLHGLPVPSFSGKRMRLPCISFAIIHLSTTRTGSERIFQLQTATFDDIEIRTTEDLSRLDSLILVHPWIDFLLDRRSVDDVGGPNQSTSLAHSVSDPASTARQTTGVEPSFGGYLLSGLRHVTSVASRLFITSSNVEVQPLEFLARLGQPFGALLLAPIRRNVAEYRRVAAECIIKVQIREDALLDELAANVRTLDVL